MYYIFTTYVTIAITKHSRFNHTNHGNLEMSLPLWKSIGHKRSIQFTRKTI